MQPHIKRLVLCIFIALAIFATVSGLRYRSLATIGSPQQQLAPKKQDLEDPFADLGGDQMARIFAEEGEKGPAGHWWVSAIPDRERLENNSPVVVIGTFSLMASGRFTNLILAGVTLLNAAHQPVESIRLKWALFNIDSQAVVAHGRTASFSIVIDARQAKKVKCPYINFTKISRPLVSNGLLNGNFQIQIAISSVSFRDGSSWEDGAQLNHSSIGRSGTPLTQGCRDEICFVGPDHGEAQCHYQQYVGFACRLVECMYKKV